MCARHFVVLMLAALVGIELVASRPAQRSSSVVNSYYYYELGHDAKSSVALTTPAKLATRARPSVDAYLADRDKFFHYEESKMLGAGLKLNEREMLANQIIMNVKLEEYDEGLTTPHLFSPSQHFFSVLEKVKDSPLFKYIEIMPKGGALHAHDTALSSTDYLITASYRPDLWACQRKGSHEAMLFRFSKAQPLNQGEDDFECDWQTVAAVRERYGNKRVDDYLRERFTLYPTQKFMDINDAWSQFMNIFSLLDGLVTYADVWADYYYNSLKEFHEDGVQYLEFRSTLPKLYDMEGTNYTELDTVRIYNDTLTKFKQDNPDFIGSKLIYAPLRHTDAHGVIDYILIMNEITAAFPNFVAGFDLVGQEEMGRPLKDFIPQLLAIPENINFYFHAGETNWNGASVDENLIDAVLLGTKRIGHGFALVKHPAVLEMLKQHNIAIEVNPISNQVLNLVSDLRNHPCSHFFADNYPIVISSDDPSFWKATPLSHDFYVAFLGIASQHADIRLLKQLAINSLEYSAMDRQQKREAMSKWETKWNSFIEEVIKRGNNGAGSLQLQKLD